LTTKLVQAKDVHQVLTYVETGNADVYRTDALASKKVKIMLTIAAKAHDAIVYPLTFRICGLSQTKRILLSLLQ
jgi:molybdate transport system substrate-binding protein